MVLLKQGMPEAAVIASGVQKLAQAAGVLICRSELMDNLTQRVRNRAPNRELFAVWFADRTIACLLTVLDVYSPRLACFAALRSLRRRMAARADGHVP